MCSTAGLDSLACDGAQSCTDVAVKRNTNKHRTLTLVSDSRCMNHFAQQLNARCIQYAP